MTHLSAVTRIDRFGRTPASRQDTVTSDSTPHGKLALVMGGGGARAAYQVGFLRCLARRRPELKVPILTGVSAGAINAALLASHHGSFKQAVDELEALWSELEAERVFRVDLPSLALNVLRWGLHLVSGGIVRGSKVRSFVDTGPLRNLLAEALHAVDGELTGIQPNLDTGRLDALALTASSYSTGRSTTWVQGAGIQPWTAPKRESRATTLTVDHVLASAALPIFFPAVRIGDQYYGDGGIRRTAPLSPALHLGADRIMVISTKHEPTPAAGEQQAVRYPPPAQVMGALMNSIFLDVLDQDVRRLERLNQLLEEIPNEKRNGLRPVKLLTLRPSRDLGALARDYEPQLPRGFRFLTRGLGTREAGSADALSLVLFQPDYLRRLMDQGAADAESRGEEIEQFLSADTPVEGAK